MADEHTSTETQGLERREFLQRSALVGGAAALAWAAPSVTSYGAKAFGSTVSPVPSQFSYLVAQLVCGQGADAVTYTVKWDQNNGWQTGETPFCPGYPDADKLGSELGLTITNVPGDDDSLYICRPADSECEFTRGALRLGGPGGGGCQEDTTTEIVRNGTVCLLLSPDS